MLVFGLTGGLASGKSTVAAQIRALGVPVVDADQVAREVVQQGSEGLAQVVQVFGQEILLPSGDLDRPKLAKWVFDDSEKRAKLNAILHPRIALRTQELLEEYRKGGTPLVCYEAALLVENGLSDVFRPLVVVSLSRDLQLDRAMKRDQISQEAVEKRIEAQLPLEKKVAVADFVIENNGNIEALKSQTEKLLHWIHQKYLLAGPPMG